MSYAGVYGEDETCPCGYYWRSCGIHSLTGPRPKPGDVERALERKDKEIQEVNRREIESRELYNNLDKTEKAVANALWNKFSVQYPGVKESIEEAVRGFGHKGKVASWIVGRARTICREAKIAVGVVRTLEPSSWDGFYCLLPKR